MSSQTTEIMFVKEAMKARMSEIIEKLTPDQCEHFTYALEQVASCYLTAFIHGALLIANEMDESHSLVAINSSEIQISGMIRFMAQAIKESPFSTGEIYIN